MNFFGKSKANAFIRPEVYKDAPQFFIACKLDSKARFVLPLCIREKLSISKGETVLLELLQGEGDCVVVNVSKGDGKGLRRTSKNGWESCP